MDFLVCIYIYTLSAHVHLVLCDATVHFPTYPLYIYIHTYISNTMSQMEAQQEQKHKEKSMLFSKQCIIQT